MTTGFRLSPLRALCCERGIFAPVSACEAASRGISTGHTNEDDRYGIIRLRGGQAGTCKMFAICLPPEYTPGPQAEERPLLALGLDLCGLSARDLPLSMAVQIACRGTVDQGDGLARACELFQAFSRGASPADLEEMCADLDLRVNLPLGHSYQLTLSLRELERRLAGEDDDLRDEWTESKLLAGLDE